MIFSDFFTAFYRSVFYHNRDFIMKYCWKAALLQNFCRYFIISVTFLNLKVNFNILFDDNYSRIIIY